MILVDSCVWIDWLRGRSTRAVAYLNALSESLEQEVCLSSIVYFEVLRGISEERSRRQVQRLFDRLERRDFTPTGFDWLVDWCHVARRRGLHIPKLGDWLLVKTLIDHDLLFLTSDQDFVRLARIVPLRVCVGASD